MSLDEAARIIHRLEQIVSEGRIVLIGGQAVALWSSQLADYLPAEAEPVTSRDFDFQGSRSDVEFAAALLDGEFYLPDMDNFTPMTGKTVFLDSEGYKRTLDFLAQPYGLDADDVQKTAIEIDVLLEDGRAIPLWVMHPERCLRSRVANSALPNKQTDLAWRQLNSPSRVFAGSDYCCWMMGSQRAPS